MATWADDSAGIPLVAAALRTPAGGSNTAPTPDADPPPDNYKTGGEIDKAVAKESSKAADGLQTKGDLDNQQTLGPAGIWHLDDGTPVHFANPPTENDIDEAYLAHNQNSPGGDARQFTSDLNDSLHKGVADVESMGETALHKLGLISDSTDKNFQQQYNENQQLYTRPDTQAPSSVGDVVNSKNPGFDAARLAGTTLGNMLPYLPAYEVGGPLAGAAVVGGTAADKTSRETSDPGTIAASGLLNGALGLMPAPFVGKAGLSTTGKALRLGIGGALTGTAQGATDNIIPYMEGKTDSPLPTADQLATGLVTGGALGPVAGALHLGEHTDYPDQPEAVDPTQASPEATQQAKSQLTARYNDITNGGPATASKTHEITDQAHGQIASDINGIKANFKPALDPTTATSLDDLLDRTGALSTLKDAVNKVKNYNAEPDIAKLMARPTNDPLGPSGETIGDTTQGQQLASLIRQSSLNAGFARGSGIGGLARFTSAINPLSEMLPGSDRSIGSRIGSILPKLMAGELVGSGSGLPGVASMGAGTLLGADVAARALGKLGDTTGLWAGNSKLNNFMRANNAPPAPIDTTGARDVNASNVAEQNAQNQMMGIQTAIQAQNARYKLQQQQAQQQQSDAMRSQSAYDGFQAQQARNQQQDSLASQKTWDAQVASGQAAQAKLAGQQQSDSIASQKAWDAYRTQMSADADSSFDGVTRAARASQKAWDAYNGQRLSDARASQKTYEGMLNAQQTAAARFQRSASDQADLDAQQRIRAARFENNDPGQSGFDKMVKDRTGLNPQEALMGVHMMKDKGVIQQEQVDRWMGDPKSLMNHNVGNGMIDVLKSMGDAGQVARDPTWSPQQARGPQTVDDFRTLAYKAQAEANQARVTESIGRVANDGKTSNADKTAIMDGLSKIGQTNNKADATSIGQDVLRKISPEAQDLATREMTHVISNIRHNTSGEADQAFAKDAGDAMKQASDIEKNGVTKANTDAALGEHAGRFRELFNEFRDGGMEKDEAAAQAAEQLAKEIRDAG